jgi:2-keto-4-pentenoate hydratase/2-oxohepta-3-ene-1,7-dioic acid hydratase in catechol pathway
MVQRRRMSVQDALDHVLVTRLVWISATATCKKRKQFGRCKSFDSYTFGPFVYSGVDVGDLPSSFRQNGELRQQRTSRSTRSRNWFVRQQSMTLAAGDLILTGTPPASGRFGGRSIEAKSAIGGHRKQCHERGRFRPV